MPDLIGVFVFPLIVAVFALVIEYWVIQPFKNRERTTESINSVPEKGSSSLSKVIINFILLSGVIAFLLAIFIFLGGFKVSEFSIAGVPIKISSQPILANSFLSDANISFAAILYAYLTLNIVSSRLKSLSWFRTFTFFILPSSLFFLWVSMFTQGILLAICLLLINLWLSLMVGVLSHKNGMGKTKKDAFASRQKSISSSLTFFLFLLPTNALILIFMVHYDAWLAWFLSFMCLIINVFVYIMIVGEDSLEFLARLLYGK
jgi:hypothetical protein